MAHSLYVGDVARLLRPADPARSAGTWRCISSAVRKSAHFGHAGSAQNMDLHRERQLATADRVVAVPAWPRMLCQPRASRPVRRRTSLEHPAFLGFRCDLDSWLHSRLPGVTDLHLGRRRLARTVGDWITPRRSHGSKRQLQTHRADCVQFWTKSTAGITACPSPKFPMSAFLSSRCKPPRRTTISGVRIQGG